MIKTTKTIKRKRTEKQKRLVKLISENISAEKPLSKTEMLKRAGYSESSASQQRCIMKGVEEQVNSIIEELERERQAIMIEMEKKRPKATYGELVRGADIMIKNKQLLSGKATETYNIYDPEQIHEAAREITDDRTGGEE